MEEAGFLLDPAPPLVVAPSTSQNKCTVFTLHQAQRQTMHNATVLLQYRTEHQ